MAPPITTRCPVQQGFTLIELLLVALLMGLMATAVLLSVNIAGGDKRLEEAAQKFSALSEMALEEAVLSSRDLGIVFEQQSYQFVELVEQRWQPLQDPLYKQQQLTGYRFEVTVEGFPWQPQQSDFSTETLFEDDEFFESQDEGKKLLTPQVLLLSSGEVTGFELIISDNRQQEPQQITINASGLGVFTLGKTQ